MLIVTSPPFVQWCLRVPLRPYAADADNFKPNRSAPAGPL